MSVFPFAFTLSGRLLVPTHPCLSRGVVACGCCSILRWCLCYSIGACHQGWSPAAASACAKMQINDHLRDKAALQPTVCKSCCGGTKNDAPEMPPCVLAPMGFFERHLSGFFLFLFPGMFPKPFLEDARYIYYAANPKLLC